MNTKENIWAIAQLKLLEGFEVSVVRYWSFNRDLCRSLLCCYRTTRKEKSILVYKISNRNAMFVTAWMDDYDGVKSSKKLTPAVHTVFRYGSNPSWVTYRIKDTNVNNSLE